jgi:transposase
LPGYLNDAAQLLRTLGQGDRIDELSTAMNRAAEAAVPLSKNLLLKAVQTMSVTDAKDILSGGNTAVTEFFATKTRPGLSETFLPVVTKATAKVGLAEKYNQFAGKASEMGLMKKEDATIQQYVTGKTLDGLYFMISEEEKKIRQNPVGYGSALLGKVFGALK